MQMAIGMDFVKQVVKYSLMVVLMGLQNKILMMVMEMEKEKDFVRLMELDSDILIVGNFNKTK